MGVQVLTKISLFGNEHATVPTYGDLIDKADRSYVDANLRIIREDLSVVRVDLKSCIKEHRDTIKTLKTGIDEQLKKKADLDALDQKLKTILSEEKMWQVRAAISQLLNEHIEAVRGALKMQADSITKLTADLARAQEFIQQMDQQKKEIQEWHGKIALAMAQADKKKGSFLKRLFFGS